MIIIQQQEEAGVLSGVTGKQTLLYETLAYVNDWRDVTVWYLKRKRGGGPVKMAEM